MARVAGPIDPERPAGRLRAELADGTAVVCARHPVPQDIPAATLLGRLREMADLRHPNLLPILGGGLRGKNVWVFSEDDGGITLERLLERHALTPAQAVAIGLSVLTGLQALQREGFGHGALTPRNVQIAGFGQVRLTDFGMTARPEARADVTAAGLLICAALGVDPAQGLGEGLGRNGRAFPGLAATALTVASGNAGRSATTALNMLTDAAGRLGGRGRVYLSVAELERLVGNQRPAIRSAVDAVVSRKAARVDAPPADEIGGAIPAAVVAAPLTRTEPDPVPVLPDVAPAAPVAVSAQSPRPRRLAAPPPPPPVEAAPATPAAPLDAPSPRVRRSRPLGPILVAAGALLLLLAAVAAGSHRPAPVRSTARVPASASTQVSKAAAAPAAPAAPAVAPGAVAGQAPDAVVRTFYSAVLAHRFDAALALWDDHMRAAYPPEQNLNQRFAATTALTVNQAAVRSQDANTAVVYTDLTEVTDGVEYHWVGPWTLVRSGQGWLLDQPNFQPA